MSPIRRLAAILAADVAGYSRLIGADEQGTLNKLRSIRTEVVDPKISEHHGRLVKTTGDGLLVEFGSVVDALRCAVEVQQSMTERNIGAGERIEFRIGINVGDIVVEDGDIFGDGVNVAARLEALSEPGGICVSARVQEDAAGKLDLAFDDIGEQALKNIARPIRAYRIRIPVGATAAIASAIRGTPALDLPDKPSIAVLPFQNMSGDPEQEYFVDGMVEEIITALSRIRWLFVIARNSSFTYKGRAVDVKQVGRELGVRYVLEGSVRKAGNRVRITGQLIDTSTGAHIWADRFDGSLQDVFDLQDQVASGVVGAIEPKLRQSEIERSVRKPTESLDAYDLYLRGLADFYKASTGIITACHTAIELLRKALAIDPAYAPAAGLLAYIRIVQIVNAVPLTRDDMAEGQRSARLAIDMGKDDPNALWMGGFSLAVLDGDNAGARIALDRATTLNPNCAHAWYSRAAVDVFANRPDTAITAMDRAIRLSPLDPLGFDFKLIRALALMLASKYEEAMEWVDQSLHDRPDHQPTVRAKMALCGYLGHVEKGREWVARMRELNPTLTIATFRALADRFLSPWTIESFVEGYRRAGLPEC
jgi:adenylate cyclase